jgi:hypothetical protein
MILTAVFSLFLMDMEVVKCQITVLKEWETSLEKKSLKPLGISAKQLKQFLQRLITNVDSLMLKTVVAQLVLRL